MATSDICCASLAKIHRDSAADFRVEAKALRAEGREGLAVLFDGWAVEEDRQAAVYERDFAAEADALREPPIDHGATQRHIESVSLTREELDGRDTESMRLEELDAAPARQEGVYNGD